MAEPITEDQKVELRKLLAEKVMGWKEPTLDHPWCHVAIWNPPESIEQAFMVAEKIGGLKLEQIFDRVGQVGLPEWHAEFPLNSWAWDKTPAMAICLAAREWIKCQK